MRESSEYVYQPELTELSFDECVRTLQQRLPGRTFRQLWVPFTSTDALSKVASGLPAFDIPLEPFVATQFDFDRYKERAEYSVRHPSYYSWNLSEKSFEHFVVAHLLKPRAGEVFIDVASEGSPLPDIMERICSCETYAQDIMYPEGIDGCRIGGDACRMPVPDAFADVISLTCSLEHFENDSDTRLFRELARVLRPGGRVVVVPLYAYPSPAVQTDPRYSVSTEVHFDDGAAIYCAKDWGNRHGRFYSPETLHQRIVDPLRSFFDFKTYAIDEPFVSNSEIYARLALVACRR